MGLGDHLITAQVCHSSNYCYSTWWIIRNYRMVLVVRPYLHACHTVVVTSVRDNLSVSIILLYFYVIFLILRA